MPGQTTSYGSPWSQRAQGAVSNSLEAIEARLAVSRRDATGGLPSRTAETEQAYRRAYRQFLAAADIPQGLDDVDRLWWALRWFAMQHNRWKRSTIRHHEAVFLWSIETLAYSGLLDETDVRDAIMLLDLRPEQRTAGGADRTGAAKRKTFSREEQSRLVQHLAKGNRTERLLAGLVGWGPHLALRPAEYETAFLRGHTLIVRCGKSTNGRAVGNWRSSELVGLDARMLGALENFLQSLQKAGRSAPSWTAFHERLAKSLTRACHRLGIAPISLYTLLHQAIANAKGMLSRLEVAALAGHLSIDTSSRHYATRRDRWGTALICLPSAVSIGSVRVPKARRNFYGSVLSSP